jgi:hypothetical protein
LLISELKFPSRSNQATAEIAPPGDVGVWLYSYINSDSGDCEDTLAARTVQDLTYQMGPPTTSFGISSVRVDLIANGVASFSLGDYGWFTKADPYYEHLFVQLDVYIAQQINGAWHQWPDRAVIDQPAPGFRSRTPHRETEKV